MDIDDLGLRERERCDDRHGEDKPNDRDDAVIPIAESRQMWSALAGRSGAHFTEIGMFQHVDPTKQRVSPLVMVRELAKFYRLLYPLFRQAVAS